MNPAKIALDKDTITWVFIVLLLPLTAPFWKGGQEECG
jgi:hypothetical protein